MTGNTTAPHGSAQHDHRDGHNHENDHDHGHDHGHDYGYDHGYDHGPAPTYLQPRHPSK
jgi:hypothetical protein